WQIAAALLLVVVVAAAVTGAALSGGRHSRASATGTSYDGTVYIESNQAKPNQNSVLAFRYRSGSLSPLNVREYPTGGSGSHDLLNTGVLDAEQQVVTNADRTLLFAPNAGSDTLAVFHIAKDGTPAPVDGS